MKSASCLILYLIIPAQLCAQSLDFLPGSKLFQKFYADALSHQFSLSKDFGSREWFGNVGADIPLINFKYEENILQVSAAATVFNTIIKTPGHMQVYTVDYLVDFFFDCNLRPEIPLRFTFGHLSAHYSDDGITELGHSPISYVRDYVGLHTFYNFGTSKIYAGYYYNFHIEPELDKKSNFQIGGDKFFILSGYLNLYGAADFKFKSEVKNIPTQSYQVGIQLSESNIRSVRFAYTFRNGYEERGQLYNIKDKKHSLGIFLDM